PDVDLQESAIRLQRPQDQAGFAALELGVKTMGAETGAGTVDEKVDAAEGIAGLVGNADGGDAADARKPSRDVVGTVFHLLPDGCVIERHPAAQGSNGADDRLLAGLHGTADAAALG